MNIVSVLKNKILQLFVLIDKFIYSFFKAITKVDNKLIIFEGMLGRYDESSWVLYHHLKKKGKYKFVWIVTNPSNYEPSADTIYVSRYHRTFNILADYYYAKAAYSFYTHTTSPIKYKRQGQKKIYIGHGYAIKGGKSNGRQSFNNFDYALATGKNAIPTQALFVGCEENELLPLGLPRNDLLYRNSGQGTDNPFIVGTNFKKVILWMPTFRESANQRISEQSCATETGLPLFDTEEKVIQLNEYLSFCGCAILLKIHPFQSRKQIFKKKFSNIVIVTNEDIDNINEQLYEFVGFSDALLTDYSSISVDYLLLDKPIGYILFDLEAYEKDRGFTSGDPRDVMAGDLLYSIDEVYKFIDDVCDDNDIYTNQRGLLREKLHAASKGNSCELICNFFKL